MVKLTAIYSIFGLPGFCGIIKVISATVNHDLVASDGTVRLEWSDLIEKMISWNNK